MCGMPLDAQLPMHRHARRFELAVIWSMSKDIVKVHVKTPSGCIVILKHGLACIES